MSVDRHGQSQSLEFEKCKRDSSNMRASNMCEDMVAKGARHKNPQGLNTQTTTLTALQICIIEICIFE